MSLLQFATISCQLSKYKLYGSRFFKQFIGGSNVQQIVFDKLDDKLKIKALKTILGRTNNLATIILLASIIRSIGKERAIEELGEKKYSVFANSAVSNFSESYNLQYASCHSKPLIVDAIKNNQQQIEMPSEVIVADQLEALINMDVISLDSTLDSWDFV